MHGARSARAVGQSAAVAAVAADNSADNTNPALLRSSIIGLVGAVGTILALYGLTSGADVEQLKAAVGSTFDAIVVVVTVGPVIIGFVAGVVTRAKAWAPQHVAMLAILNTDHAYQAGLNGKPKPVPVITPLRQYGRHGGGQAGRRHGC